MWKSEPQQVNPWLNGALKGNEIASSVPRFIILDPTLGDLLKITGEFMCLVR